MASTEKTAKATASSGINIDVRAYPIKEPRGKSVAFASATVNNMIGINGIQVIDGKNGLFVQMPQTKTAEGEYKDIAFPVTKELRLELNKAVLECYAAEKDRGAHSKASVKEQLREGKDAATVSPKSTPAKDAPAKDTPSAARGKTTKTKTEPEH